MPGPRATLAPAVAEAYDSVAGAAERVSLTYLAAWRSPDGSGLSEALAKARDDDVRRAEQHRQFDDREPGTGRFAARSRHEASRAVAPSRQTRASRIRVERVHLARAEQRMRHAIERRRGDAHAKPPAERVGRLQRLAQR